MLRLIALSLATAALLAGAAQAATPVTPTGAVDGWDATKGAKADGAWTSGAGSLISILKAIDRDTLLPLAAGANLIGAVVPNAATTGGATRLCTGQIKATATACGSAGAHQVYTYELDNTGNTLASYFQFFDVIVGSVTLGTTVATMGVSVPAGGAMIVPVSVGDAYANQITLACTTTATGLTAPTNNCGYTVFAK